MAQFLDDPNEVGLLSLGLRLMSTPGKFGAALGQSGLGAMGDMQQAKLAKQAAEQRAAQQQLLQMQMQQMIAKQAAAKKAEAQQATDTTLMRSMMGDGSQGPELPNDPRMFLSRGGSMSGVQGLMGLNAAMAPKPKDLMTVAPGATVLDPKDPTKPLFTAPDKAAAPTPTQLAKLIQERDALPPGHPNRALYDQEIRKMTTHAPGVSVSVPVNLGQKGLDNTLKLRGDFRSEPIYKAHQDVMSAHSQITTALKQASPAGDLAGATKLMKILDPGSVVRESELGMAMAASGALDRLSNYASMVITGKKLTPTQRIDFQTLADSLFKESERLYNAKRSEYAGIVKRNELNEADVLGPAPATPTDVDALVNKYRTPGGK